MGDVVEPLGVEFRNPMPLLLGHDSRLPVGTVKFAKPTADGIDFTAQIPVIDEPPSLKDRVDTAWASVKAGLLKGVSIGFRPLEEAFDKTTGGMRFLRSEVLELSLVAVPANADATIATIKSLDLAASGHQPPHAAGLPVVARKDAPKAMKPTIAEQIKSYKDTRSEKADARTAIMTKASDAGVTLDAAETETYDTLAAEIASIDAHLVRLKAMEQEMKDAAVPAIGDNPANASVSRSGQPVITVKENLLPGIGFARYAMCLAAAKGFVPTALSIAQNRYKDMKNLHMVLKASIDAGTTTDPTWAGALVQYQEFSGDFIEFLRPATIIGKFGTGSIPSLRRIPFNVRIKGQTSGGDGYWVGQGQAKPLTKFDFDTVNLKWAKAAAIAVLTEELVRFSSPSAEMLVRDALAAAVIERLDIDFVDPNKQVDADVSPASITNGATELQPSGTDAAAVREDVRAIMGTFIAANITPSAGVWIMTSTTALALSLMRNALGQEEFPGITMMGGTFMGLPVITSQYLASLGSPSGNIVVLVNASDIYLADDGQVVIDASREASLEMSSTPTGRSGGTNTNGSPINPVANELVSMWQTNSVALRAERFINWQRRRQAAVSYFDNVKWGQGE